ncbi:hypothetical protein ACU4GA_07625 [Methylobacterium oryzae CBMB20]
MSPPASESPARFRSLYRHGFARVAACTGRSHPAEPERNAGVILGPRPDLPRSRGGARRLQPTLGLSAYAIEDLLLQQTLLDAVEVAAARVVAESAQSAAASDRRRAPALAAPASTTARSAIQGGRVLGVVPKTFLPNYREFYEKRHFASGAGIAGETIRVAGHEAPFGTDLVVRPAEDLPGLVVGAESARILWVPRAPRHARGASPEPPCWRISRAARSPHQPGRVAGAPCPGRPRCAAPARTSTRRPARANRPPTCPGTARPASTSWACGSPRASGSPRSR